MPGPIRLVSARSIVAANSCVAKTFERISKFAQQSANKLFGVPLGFGLVPALTESWPLGYFIALTRPHLLLLGGSVTLEGAPLSDWANLAPPLS